MRNFLSETEKNTLLCQHRSEKNRRVGDRIKAILLSDKGWSRKKIAEVLLLDQETVSRHLIEYHDSKKLRIESGGSVEKLNKEQTSSLIMHLAQETYVKVSDICRYIENVYQINYSVRGMTCWLHRHKFSFKKPKPTPYKADPIKQEAFIEIYREIIQNLPSNQPVEFADATHPTMATKISYGWIQTGVNKPIATTASRTRCNILGSINLKTMDLTVGSFDTINSESMEAHFIKLREKYPQAPMIHLIVDQGSYNKSKQTLEAAKRSKVCLHYLPPYSPNLNPIERLWKLMNENVRNNTFFESAKEFRTRLSNFFNNSWENISESMRSLINDNFQILESTF